MYKENYATSKITFEGICASGSQQAAVVVSLKLLFPLYWPPESTKQPAMKSRCFEPVYTRTQSRALQEGTRTQWSLASRTWCRPAARCIARAGEDGGAGVGVWFFGGSGMFGLVVSNEKFLIVISRELDRINVTVFLPVPSLTTTGCVSFQYPTVQNNLIGTGVGFVSVKTQRSICMCHVTSKVEIARVPYPNKQTNVGKVGGGVVRTVLRRSHRAGSCRGHRVVWLPSPTDGTICSAEVV